MSPPNDAEKYLVGVHIKRVLDLLSESKQALTAEQINEYVHVKGNKAFETLAKNPKVHFDGHRFSYKLLHYLRDEMLLRRLTREFANADLKDASVMEEKMVDDELES